MKTKYKILIILLSIAWVGTYLAFSFIVWQFNPSLWDEGCRFGYIMVAFMLSIFFLPILAD